MNLIYGNLWDQQADAICITTNGFVTKGGKCVMGRGCAEEAVKRFPKVAKQLGYYIRRYGNVVNPIGWFINNGYRTVLISFPVKPAEIKSKNPHDMVSHMRGRLGTDRDGYYHIPGWACKADLSIIEQSCQQIVHIANILKLKKIVLPRPGIGYGELKWEDVQPILEKYLDDRFHIITFR